MRLICFASIGWVVVKSYREVLLMKAIKLKYFMQFYSVMDLMMIILTLILSLKVLINFQEGSTIDNFIASTKAERIYEAIIFTLVYIKSNYFLGLVKECASLIDTIKFIFYDIRYFMLLLGL